MDWNMLNGYLQHTTIIVIVLMKLADFLIKRAKWTPATETIELALDLISTLAAKGASALRAQLPEPAAVKVIPEAPSVSIDAAAEAMPEAGQ